MHSHRLWQSCRCQGRPKAVACDRQHALESDPTHGALPAYRHHPARLQNAGPKSLRPQRLFPTTLMMFRRLDPDAEHDGWTDA